MRKSSNEARPSATLGERHHLLEFVLHCFSKAPAGRVDLSPSGSLTSQRRIASPLMKKEGVRCSIANVVWFNRWTPSLPHAGGSPHMRHSDVFGGRRRFTCVLTSTAPTPVLPCLTVIVF